ncbi:MAG: hypothetical protein CEE42_05610 [Promethearchaeota archaeon Loki_b31]|nr:MAG: hypothetical protein CEE42_05610 [Candidatus Lokiarchaeota archaeon Loki_b31]
MIIVKDKEELPWITLEEERDANEEEEDFLYNHEFVERIEELHAIYDIREIMYPECKEAEEPAIMDDVEAFRYGFKYPESAHRNLTKSTLSKILKNFVGFSSLTDLGSIVENLIDLTGIDFVHNELVHNTVKFLTQLFDLEGVREQVKAYLTNPYTHKSKGLAPALEYLLTREPRITEAEKRVISELLGFLQE